MAATVDEDISRDTIAAMAREAVLAVALFGGCLIPLHSQVVMGHPQLPVSWFWVQPEWLTFKGTKKKRNLFLKYNKMLIFRINSGTLLNVTYCWFWVLLVHCCGFLPGLWPLPWKCIWFRIGDRAQCSDFAWCLVQSSSCQWSYTNLEPRQTHNNPVHGDSSWWFQATFNVHNQEAETIQPNLM